MQTTYKEILHHALNADCGLRELIGNGALNWTPTVVRPEGRIQETVGIEASRGNFTLLLTSGGDDHENMPTTDSYYLAVCDETGDRLHLSYDCGCLDVAYSDYDPSLYPPEGPEYSMSQRESDFIDYGGEDLIYPRG